MFSTVFKHTLRQTLRQKSIIFWSLAFPVILSTLFFMAFGNIYTAEVIKEPIKVAYVAPQIRNPFYDMRGILASIPLRQGSEEKLLQLTDATAAEAEALVTNEEVAAAVVDGAAPQLLLKGMSAEQVVIKQVLDQLEATRRTMTSLIMENPRTDTAEAVRLLNEADFTQTSSPGGDRMKPDIIYYMALLAMTCLGACSSGAMVVIQQQANRSTEGARATVSPASKWLRVFAAGLASYLVQLAMTFVVLAYMTLGLGVFFGDSLGFILLVLTVGTAMGFMLGMAVAAVVRGSSNLVLNLVAAVYLFSSFLSGLMSHQVKRLVEVSAPFVAKVNPGTIIVDALHSIYYFREADYSYLGSMLVACLVFSGFIALSLGRRYHDSI